ncbi:hypothetical protein [Escherichia coli]|uniref:hypothetical protein n=1 Tax=Escherichia coli TaxID=562 RepID=UPI00191A73F0|nr:hypothetical protein [Escherichia coli]
MTAPDTGNAFENTGPLCGQGQIAPVPAAACIAVRLCSRVTEPTTGPARHFRCAKQQSDVATTRHDSLLPAPIPSGGNNLTHSQGEAHHQNSPTGQQETGQ